MASTVEADLRQLKLAMAIYHRIDNAIQQDEIYEELAERLREELDYLREAAQMRLYGFMLGGEAMVHVPVPFAGYSTKRLLTMTWLEGRPLLHRLEEDPPQEERNQIAEALFRAWYVPFYRYGVLHGDPHLGNYQVRPDGSVNLLDFGVIRVFAAKFVRGVIDLFEAVRDNDDEKAHHAYATWGFANISRAQLAVLNEWARFLYEPLMQDRVRLIQETNDTQYGRVVAERVHAGLKRTGGVRPPREFVLMDRSAIGLGGVFLRLRAELNWSRMFHGLIADFDAAALAERQATALREAGVPEVKRV
jgi:predicted unusual protein kinase regulating ubiquinone biosynthesis (AarF/ABC1/UbiB family)